MPAHSSDANRMEAQLREACRELESRLRAGEDCPAEAYRTPFPDLWAEPEAALELIFTEFVCREQLGQEPNRQDWYRRFPQWGARLEKLFHIHDLMAGAPAAATPVPQVGHET